MFRKPAVFPAISPETFTTAPLDPAIDLFRYILPHIIPLDNEKIFVMPDILAVYIVEIALGEGQVIDGIKKIGLARAVITGKKVDLAAERKL
jgi:hypothetical protein